AFTGFGPSLPQKIVYDPKADKTFPAGMGISSSRPATWTEDLGGLLFGIHEAKKKDDKTPAKEEPKKEEPKKDPPGTKPPMPAPTPPKPPAPAGDSDKPDLVIWHWADSRLQSQQQVEAGRDRQLNNLCVYRVKEKKFLRLSDDKLPRVVPAPKQRWAIGYDNK